ncbi:hypothetical protein [Methanoregula sp.]|jgi:hypothetical protein|uniref:hypothetical protein n=1 Tax=Methanoregula sp. TaxID=2052170 RepID=UPI0035690408
MQRKRVILLVILGGVLSLAAGFIAIAGPSFSSFTPLIVLIILAAMVVVLLIREFRQWVESLVEKLAAGNRINPPETAGIPETIASLRAEIERINQRLEALEKKERE